MGLDFGAQSMVGKLRRVVVRLPDEAMAAADPGRWHYSAPIDLDKARHAHRILVDALSDASAEVIIHDAPLPEHSDSVFVFDPVLVTDAGSVILSMGKPLRRGEEEPLARCLEAHGVPVHARLQDPATAEGGDTMWIDHDTLAVGRGFRTNGEAVRQLRSILEPLGVAVLDFELPYYTGPEACLHLLSLISPVADRLAVAYPPLMPAGFWRELHERGWTLLEVPYDEFAATQATNVLAVEPGKVIMLEDNPITRRMLLDAGCDVRTVPGRELSFKAEGGLTCLTRPVLRD